MPEKKYYRALGESTYQRLRELHCTYGDDIADKMRGVFGEPLNCLVCDKPLNWHGKRVPSDIDPWFCNGCCPVCNSVEHDQA